MTFSGHAAVAALTFSLTREPAVLIPLNIVLHYATDAIPHAEFFFAKTTISRFSWMLFDTLLTACLIWLSYSRLDLSPLLVGAVFGASILPDLIDPLTRKLAKPIRWFHLLMHTWPEFPRENQGWSITVTGRTPTILKLLIQAGLIFLAFTWLLK